MLAFYDRSDFADVVKKWYDGYREVLCYGIAFYKKNCKITVKKTKDRILWKCYQCRYDILYDVRRQSDASKTYGGTEIKTGRRIAGDFSWIIRCA